MTVLARNAGQVILRDPNPVAGMRVIESRGLSIAVPFVDLQLKLVTATSNDARIEIRVLGRDRIDLPVLRSRRLALYNFDPGRLRVLCGKPLNYGDPTLIRLDAKGGNFAASCPVRILKPGTIRIDGSLSEVRAGIL